MTSPSHIYVVTPAYNEAEALRELLPDLAAHLKPLGIPFTLCVVDDGSTDNMEHVARNVTGGANLQYVKHQKNQGYGGALRTGISWALKNAQPQDVIVTLDADNTHPPAVIQALVAKIQEGYGVITASYTIPGGASRGVPFKRKVLSFGANLLFTLRFRLPGVTTYTNGFRAYRVQDLLKAQRRWGPSMMESTDFSGGTELFIKTVREGARAGEIPFELRYDRRGTSKIRILNTIRAYLKLLQ